MSGGRPTIITHPLQVTDPLTGEARQTTVAERIVDLIETGAYAERAARSCGVATSTFYAWLDQGGKVRQRLGIDPQAKMTVADRRHLEFLEAVEAAEFRYEMTALQALEAIALGRITTETVTEKYTAVTKDDGTVEQVLAERTVRTQQQLPSAAAIQWKLTRRFPERYQLHDDPVADDRPDLTADNVNRLVDDVADYLAQMQAKAAVAKKARKKANP